MIGRARSLRLLAALLAVAVACSSAAACSKDSGSDGAAATTSTSEAGSPASATTNPGPATTKPGSATTKPGSATTKPGSATTKPGSATTKPGPVTTKPGPVTTKPGPVTTKPGPVTTEVIPTTRPGPATTAVPNAPPPEDFSGPFDGQDSGTSISFTKASDVSSVEVEGLVVDCNPIEGDGDPSTTTIDLSFPKVPVAADGSVELDLPDDPYHPTLSGTFTPEGTFAGNVYVTFEQKGLACGGDYPFTAEPS